MDASTPFVGLIMLKRRKPNGGGQYNCYADPEREFPSLAYCQTKELGIVLAEWVSKGRMQGTGQPFKEWADSQERKDAAVMQAQTQQSPCKRKRRATPGERDEDSGEEEEEHAAVARPSPAKRPVSRPPRSSMPAAAASSLAAAAAERQWAPRGKLGVRWNDKAYREHQLCHAAMARGSSEALGHMVATISRGFLVNAAVGPRAFLSDAEQRALLARPENAGKAEKDWSLATLAGALFSCENMAGPHCVPATGLPVLQTIVSAEHAIALITEGKWTAEHGPMVIPHMEREKLVTLGLRVPEWKSYIDVARMLSSDVQLSCANLGTGATKQQLASRVLERFTAPAGERTAILNSITEVTDGMRRKCGLPISMPSALEDARASYLWWPKVETFLLLSMAGSSMSYHLDLWSTAVFYHVQWGNKIFALAPPTQRNLELLQRWQQLGEPDSGWLNGPQSESGSTAEPDGGAGEAGLMFPAALEELQSAVLTGGDSILIPAGWIHAVWTLEDSCVLGWNFHTASQLSVSLPVALADWGDKSHEMRQPAFSTKELVEQLWALATAVVSALALTDSEFEEQEVQSAGALRGAGASELERRARVVCTVATGLRRGPRRAVAVASGMLTVAELLYKDKGAQKKANQEVLERLRSAALAVQAEANEKAAAHKASAERTQQPPPEQPRGLCPPTLPAALTDPSLQGAQLTDDAMDWPLQHHTAESGEDGSPAPSGGDECGGGPPPADRTDDEGSGRSSHGSCVAAAPAWAEVSPEADAEVTAAGLVAGGFGGPRAQWLAEGHDDNVVKAEGSDGGPAHR